MKPKTVARNEVESGFKESASMTQIHVVSPQGKLEIRKALNEGICLLSVFSHTHLRRCCRLLSLVKVFQYATLSLPQGKIKK